MAPRFEPLRIYDAPGVLASQLIEGEASFSTIKNTFLSPNSLTPEQRTDLGDRLASAQGDPLSKAMVGVATNPWIWVGFLMGPVGSKALQAGRSLFSVKHAYSAYLRTGGGFLDSLRTPLKLFDGTALPEIGLGIAEDYQALMHASKASRVLGKTSLQEAEEVLYRRLNEMVGATQKPTIVPGLQKGLSAVNYAPGSAENQVLRRLEFAMAARSLNLDGSQGLQKIVRSVGPGGKVMDTVEDVEVLFQKEGIDQILDEVGPAAEEYMRAAGRSKQWSFVQMIGDEAKFAETGEFAADSKKLERLAGAFLRSGDEKASIGAMGSTMYGRDAVISLIGPKRFEQLMKLSDNPREVADRIRKDLQEVVTPTAWGESWGSRNLLDVQPVRQVDGTFKKLLPTDAVQRSAQQAAPWAASQASRGTARAIPLEIENAYIHIEDMDEFSGLLTDAGRAHRAKAAGFAQQTFEEQGDRVATFGVRLRFTDAHERYTASVNQATALETRQASAAMLRADTATIDAIGANKQNNKIRLGALGTEIRVTDDLSKLTPDQLAMVSPATLIDKVYGGLQSASLQTRLREVFIPNALNSAGPHWISQFEAQMRAKETMGWFANSLLGRGLKNLGGAPKQFVDKLEAQSKFDGPLQSNMLRDGLTRWLYASHLGFNPSSVMLNLTQPLLLAATVAKPTDIVRAYGDAINEMSRYASKRAQIGRLTLTPQQSQKLLEETFEGVAFKVGDGLPRNLLGLGPDFNDLYDSAVTMNKGAGRTFIDLAMKGFEKSEHFNRAVSYHLLKRAYVAAGRNLDDVVVREQFANDARRFILETQFGASSLNTPGIFQNTILRNPLLRMFMTFPLRSAMGALDTFPTLGEAGRLEGAVRFGLRSMGLSAFVYEVGKGLAGVDMSRGLTAEAAFSFAGGSRFFEADGELLPIPPVIAMPVDFLRSVANDDMRLLSNAVARTIPGGIALNRAIGVAPDLDGTLGLPSMVGQLQQTYVDWNNPTPDGMYPYYDGAGNLIDYRSGPEIMMRAVGVDFNAWNAQGGFDNYLNKQRDEVNQMKQQYRLALSQGNYGKAQGIASAFQRRFGVPLQLSRAQLEQFQGNQTTGRTERVLKRLPEEVRPTYQKLAAQSGFGQRSMSDGLGPESRAHLQAELQQIRQVLESQMPGAPGSQSFEPY